MAELRRCDFDFGRLSNELGARDAELPPSELVASLRAEVMQHYYYVRCTLLRLGAR